jgi:hypothetical protein
MVGSEKLAHKLTVNYWHFFCLLKLSLGYLLTCSRRGSFYFLGFGTRIFFLVWLPWRPSSLSCPTTAQLLTTTSNNRVPQFNIQQPTIEMVYFYRFNKEDEIRYLLFKESTVLNRRLESNLFLEMDSISFPTQHSYRRKTHSTFRNGCKKTVYFELWLISYFVICCYICTHIEPDFYQFFKTLNNIFV